MTKKLGVSAIYQTYIRNIFQSSSMATHLFKTDALSFIYVLEELKMYFNSAE